MTIADVLNMDFPEEFGCTFDSDEESPALKEVYSQLDDNVETTYGSSKFIIFLNEKEIVKIPFNGHFFYKYDEETNKYNEELLFDQFYVTDYCDIEAAVYEDAVAEGLECFFAATKWVGVTKTQKPIYVSERVYGFYNEEKRNTCVPSKDSLKKAQEADTNFPYKWLARAYEFYGDELVNRLIEFIKDTGVNDFHGDNVGFRADGAPVLLDYSGYDE